MPRRDDGQEENELDAIASALGAIKERGTFASRGTAPPEDLRIEVKDVGNVRFPISQRTVRKLIGVGRQAGYGWRDQTLVDTSVRDTWEIARSRVKIDQRRWKKTLAPQLERIKRELGLPAEGELTTRLHKMLVYETGQFFAPHQDSERSDDMVGTLSVVLPSAYKGGSVVIEHGGKTLSFRRSARSADQLTFIAFYADCHHEVRKVTEGHRVVLDYHLMFDGPAIASTGAHDDRAVENLAAHIDTHFTTPAPVSRYSERLGEPPDKLVYLLDHEYSQKSLAWNQLKNADRVRAGALLDVAQRLDCEIFLALADVHETWDCEYEDYGWGRRGYDRRRYHDWDDDEPDADSAILTDLIDSSIELRHWVDAAGKASKGVSGYVAWNELCLTRESREFEPFESEFEGWMGNYGNTAERWYHRAAVVMWPRRKSFAVRAKVSPQWAVDELGKSIRSGSLPQARENARSLLPFWNHVAAREEGKQFFEKSLRIARGLEDGELAASLLAPFWLHQLGARAVPHVVALAEEHGIEWARDRWMAWERGQVPYRPYRDDDWLALMPTFCRKLAASGSDLGQQLGQWVVARQWARLEEQTQRTLEDRERRGASEKLGKAAKQMLRVLESAVALEEKGVQAAIVAYLTSNETDYPATCLVDALRDIGNRVDANELRAQGLGAVRRHCLVSLNAALAAPARSADDWSIAPPMQCKCELCRTLGEFLANPAEVRLEWRLAEAKRSHVHREIDSYGLPVSHVTERRGRPYTLVLTKTKDLFAREAARRKSLKREIAWLNQQERALG